MEWLSPITAIYAAAIAVPLLLLLYFLKLKRQEHIVSSTFLWKKAVRDLQVNAPFQMLRRNILLLVQLLTLLIMLIALAWPVLTTFSGAGRQYVLLIDRSASMSALDGDTSTVGTNTLTRLDQAKKQAKIFVDSLQSRSLLSLKDDSDRMMVIAFDNNAKVVCNFTSDKKQLLSGIDSITTSHGKSQLAEAVAIAHASGQSPGVETDNQEKANLPQIVLFSDGQIGDLNQLNLSSNELAFYCVGSSGSNIAITAMQAKRSYQKPEDIEVFATVANYNTGPQNCDLQLSINNNVRSVRAISIEPARIDNAGGAIIPGKAAVSFTLSEIAAGVIELKIISESQTQNSEFKTQNYLTCDDLAWSVIPAPKTLEILLVTRGNVVLESALKACGFAKLQICTPEQFETTDFTSMSINPSYDIIVLDNYKPAKLPKSRYLVFGALPDGIDVSSTTRLENQVISDWRSKHPVLKYVNLSNFFCASCYEMILPRDAEVLAEFNQSPAMAIVRRNGSIFLLAGFDILQTNWPFEPGFVMFCYNAANYLGMQAQQNRSTVLQPGEPIIVDGLERDTEYLMDGPGFSNIPIQSGATGNIRFANTLLTGIYRLSKADKTSEVFAVNLLDLQESNILPMRTIVSSGGTIQAQEGRLSRANIPLWPFLVILALLLVCLEWLVYTLKIKI
jgi:hypothetical protein